MDLKLLNELMNKNENIRNVVLSAAVLVAGLLASYFLKDIRLAIIFFLIWVDRLVLGHIGLLSQFGLELTSLAVILTGLAYGPYFAAGYHFVTSTIMSGMSWHITKSSEPNWAPFIPGPDQIVDAVSAGVAGLMKSLPVVHAIVLGSIAKFLIGLAKDKAILYDKPPEVGRVLNVFVNFAIAYNFEAYLVKFVG